MHIHATLFSLLLKSHGSWGAEAVSFNSCFCALSGSAVELTGLTTGTWTSTSTARSSTPVGRAAGSPSHAVWKTQPWVLEKDWTTIHKYYKKKTQSANWFRLVKSYTCKVKFILRSQTLWNGCYSCRRMSSTHSVATTFDAKRFASRFIPLDPFTQPTRHLFCSFCRHSSSQNLCVWGFLGSYSPDKSEQTEPVLSCVNWQKLCVIVSHCHGAHLQN